MRCKIIQSVLLSMIFFNTLIFAKPPALPNLGNSCYMNAMVQCLLNIPPVKELFIGNNKLDVKHPFFNAYQKLLENFSPEDTTYLENFYKWVQVAIDFKPTKEILFIENLTQNEVDRQYETNKKKGQCNLKQDTSDVLKNIFAFVDAQDKNKNYVDPYLRNGFLNALGIKVLDGIWCNGKIDKSADLKWSLHVEIPSSYNGLGSLYDFLNKFEEVPEDYKLPEGMKRENCKKQARYVQISEFFIITLGRFRETYVLDNQGNIKTVKEKISDPIAMPFQLDMRAYMVPNFKGDPLNCAYELISFTNTGGISGGHYVAYIKDQSEKKPSWWYCSDATIIAKSEIEVEEAAQIGYIYVYRRMNEKDARKFFEERDVKKIETEEDKTFAAKNVHNFAQALSSIAKG